MTQNEKEGTGDLEPISVFVADDHAIVREGLRLILDGEPDISFAGEAADLESTLRYVRGRKPDVLVLDINLGGESGLDVIPRLRREVPRTEIVVLTMQHEPTYARRALESGARGYVVKESAASDLVQAIRLAAQGQTYLQPEVGAQLVLGGDEPRPGGLSKREVDVLRLLALGHTNAEISGQLHLSVRTVEGHRARLQEKLGLSSRSELVRYAIREGLLE